MRLWVSLSRNVGDGFMEERNQREERYDMGKGEGDLSRFSDSLSGDSAIFP